MKSFDSNSDEEIEVCLSEWIAVQHNNYTLLNDGGALPDNFDELLIKQQIAILRNINFPFHRSREERRDDYLVKLEQFKETHNHCRVPQRPKKGTDDGGLGGWVNRIRKEYKKPKCDRHLLNDNLEQKLIALGFEFNIKKCSWDEKFDELKNFKEIHGNCMVTRRHETLGKWVSDQRSLYKDGKMSDEKISMLNSIGFCWVGRKQTK